MGRRLLDMRRPVLRRLAIYVEEPEPGRFEWVLGELDGEDTIVVQQRAPRPVGSYKTAMANGLMALQRVVEDLDGGPREDLQAPASANELHDKQPSSERAPTKRSAENAQARPSRGTAFGFGLPT